MKKLFVLFSLSSLVGCGSVQYIERDITNQISTPKEIYYVLKEERGGRIIENATKAEWDRVIYDFTSTIFDHPIF
jgi:hypothetical protein